MPRCPNCSYLLVLLEKRAKYKCAKCGKLFPQKEVDNKEFREWNKRQREEDKNRKLSSKPTIKEKQKKLTQLKVYQYAQKRELFKIVNASQYKKFKDKILAKAKDRYDKLPDIVLLRNKSWRLKNRVKLKLSQDRYRANNIKVIRMKNILAELRRKQKELALEL